MANDKLRAIACVLVLAVGLVLAPRDVARAQGPDDDGPTSEGGGALADDEEPEDAEGEDDLPSYGQAGVWELGGSLGGMWTEDVFTLNVNPQVGLFVIDYFELSLVLGVEHENVRDDDGSRHGETTVSLLFEPSYHLPVIEEQLFLLGGLGVGVGYDGVAAGFDLVPRVGANIQLGRTRMLTPSLRVPIIMGTEVDDNGDGHFETSVSVGFDIGYTTLF